MVTEEKMRYRQYKTRRNNEFTEKEVKDNFETQYLKEDKEWTDSSHFYQFWFILSYENNKDCLVLL